MNRTLARLGGVFGLLSVVALISGVLVGFASEVNSLTEANSFFEVEGGAFVFFNGVIPLFFIVFFVFFLGVLHEVMRQGEGDTRADGVEGVLSTAALLGGGVYMVLAAAALATEVLYPATLLRFGEFEPGGPFVLMSLTLSSWLYHGSSVGGGALVLATSLAALRTSILPRWLALAGFVAALLSFLHFLFPFLGFVVGLVWIVAVSVLMLTGAVRGRVAGRTR